MNRIKEMGQNFNCVNLPEEMGSHLTLVTSRTFIKAGQLISIGLKMTAHAEAQIFEYFKLLSDGWEIFVCFD